MKTVKELPGKLRGVQVRSHSKVGTDDLCNNCLLGCKDRTGISKALCQNMCHVTACSNR
jgi:hypothetical protein